jgi:hypothetical protein
LNNCKPSCHLFNVPNVPKLLVFIGDLLDAPPECVEAHSGSGREAEVSDPGQSLRLLRAPRAAMRLLIQQFPQ